MSMRRKIRLGSFAKRAVLALAVIYPVCTATSRAQSIDSACMPNNNLLLNQSGWISLGPNEWAPGYSYTVTIRGTYPIASGEYCDVAIMADEWPDYPNYYDFGPLDPHIHLTNLTWVNPTTTTFEVSVDGDAPTGIIYVALHSTYFLPPSLDDPYWDYFVVSIQPPPPPGQPPPPGPGPCPTPQFDPNNPVTPDTWIPGKTYQITVKGTGFTTAANATTNCPATTITASVQSGSVDLSNIVVVDSTTITATVAPAVDDPAEMANVMLWGPPESEDDDDDQEADTASPPPGAPDGILVQKTPSATLLASNVLPQSSSWQSPAVFSSLLQPPAAQVETLMAAVARPAAPWSALAAAGAQAVPAPAKTGPCTTSTAAAPNGMVCEENAPTPITPIRIQARNVTPNLNPQLQPEQSGIGTAAAQTAHLTLGGTFQIGLGFVRLDGTFVAVPSSFHLGEATLNGADLDVNPIFKGNAVLKYFDWVDNAVVLQGTHLGTQQLTITPNDTSAIPPVTITLSVEKPNSLGSLPLHHELDSALYELADDTGIPPQMIKGQIGHESGFNPYAWRYEPFQTLVGDFGYSTKDHDFRNASQNGSQYGGLSFRLPTIGDSTDAGNCVIKATMGNVKVTVAGVLSNSVSYLNPSTAISGSQMTIVGTNFGSVQSAASVTVDGVNAVITNWSNTSITVLVPKYDYATHVDSRKQDPYCRGLDLGETFSQKVMEDIVLKGGGGKLTIPQRDPDTGAILSMGNLKFSDRYVSVYDLLKNNPISAASWVQKAGGEHDPRVVSVENRAVDFSAQLTLAASYGLIQVTYVHAIDHEWTGNSDTSCGAPTTMDPDNLFDTDCNLRHHGGSLAIGTRSTEGYFVTHRGANPSITNEFQFESDFAAEFLFYNSGEPEYGNNVIRNAHDFEPNPTGKIFSSGGEQ